MNSTFFLNDEEIGMLILHVIVTMKKIKGIYCFKKLIGNIKQVAAYNNDIKTHFK